MRLTADLILSSPAFINPVQDRELDLRGNKLSIIENLGATQDQYDTINLNDNDIQKLEGFPLLKRLKSIYISNNRISRIAPRFGQNLPSLETLILSFNKIESLQELDNLSDLKNLRVISLEKNPVTTKPNYRLYLISKLPRIKLIDFKKVKPKEKQEARRLFGGQSRASTSGPAEGTTSTAAPSIEAPVKHVSEISKRTEAVKAAIESAKTLEEMQALERNLQQGIVPPTKVKPTAMDQ
jgi:U2 small nuclear ribonucleoprotein A'